MNARVGREAPRPLLILGRVPYAADLALRRILHAKERGQSLIVVDYQGNLASFLTERNKGNLHKGPLLWCDLANRRRPTALFRFTRSPGMKPALRAFVESCTKHFAAPISAPTVDAAVELAYRLSEHGNVGLVAWIQALRRPETSHPLRRSQSLVAELDRLIEMLEWTLRFPAVWSLSEGNNHVDLERALKLGGTVWLELSGSHFEQVEHQVVSWMVDAVIADALLSTGDAGPVDGQHPHSPVILYGFPTACPLPLTIGDATAKHVGLFAFSAMHALPVAARHWLDAGADCWVSGDVGDVPIAAHTTWLDAEERTRLKDLQPGQVWVRSGANGKAVTALVRPPEVTASLPQNFRRQAQKNLRVTPVKQFSTALGSNDSRAPQNADLFRQLCTKEALFVGWFRVKSHNRLSHGHDRITIEQFGGMLDVELARLLAELVEGPYRCRPLRTARIPKADGDVRILSIACVRDRVVQAACLHLIEPLFDARFSPASFAYRPGRNAHHAVAVVRAEIRAGKQWVVTADIKKCFDSIDHDILLRLLGDVIGDRELMQLIRHWLAADVIDFMDILPSELGVPQGEAISPLFANIYLDTLDKELEQAGVTFVRYADDYVILCNTEAEAQAALRQMAEFLQGVLRLALKPAKTQYGRVADGFGFLSFQVGLPEIRISTDKVTAAVRTVSTYVENIASSQSSSMEKCRAIIAMNAVIRGFRNYFLVDDAPAIETQLSEMDAAIEALAGQRFAKDQGIELAWASREKFLPDTGVAVHQSDAVFEAAALIGAYPQHRAFAPTDDISTERIIRGTDSQDIALPSVEATPSSDLSASDQAIDPHVLVIDGRLHVMTSGCYVTVSKDELLVKRRKQEIFRIAISELTMVYLEGRGISISADLTMRLCEQNVPVVFTPLVGIPGAIAQPVLNTRSNLRQQQVIRRNDPDILKIGLGMLAAKVANQASVLKYFARYRKRTDDVAYDKLAGCADDIRGIADTLDSLDPAGVTTRTAAMGHEGRAAAKYWSSFALLIPDELSFPGRHTRHATDPVNSAINYVYTILYGEIWRAIIRAGLDPYFGIVHGKEHDQGSLVFDLIEEYRAPFGDRLVVGMIGRGFALELGKDGRIRSACRQKLAHAFHKQWHRNLRWRGGMRAPSDILELQVTSLKKAYMDNDEYRPFRFRW